MAWDRDRTYDLNGDDSRTLTTVGMFRMVPQSGLRDKVLDPRPRAWSTCATKASLRPCQSTAGGRGRAHGRGRELLASIDGPADGRR